MKIYGKMGDETSTAGGAANMGRRRDEQHLGGGDRMAKDGLIESYGDDQHIAVAYKLRDDEESHHFRQRQYRDEFPKIKKFKMY